MTQEKENSTQQPENNAEKTPFNGLEGVYLGFSPTDASPIATGEMELSIQPEMIRIRMATGSEIREEELQIGEAGISELSTEQIEATFPNLTNSKGLRVFAADGQPWLAFSDDSEKGPSVKMFLDESIEAFLGPTLLYTPKQVDLGYLEEAIVEIEKAWNIMGGMPRLSNNGLPLTKDS